MFFSHGRHSVGLTQSQESHRHRTCGNGFSVTCSSSPEMPLLTTQEIRVRYQRHGRVGGREAQSVGWIRSCRVDIQICRKCSAAPRSSSQSGYRPTGGRWFTVQISREEGDKN